MRRATDKANQSLDSLGTALIIASAVPAALLLGGATAYAIYAADLIASLAVQTLVLALVLVVFALVATVAPGRGARLWPALAFVATVWGFVTMAGDARPAPWGQMFRPIGDATKVLLFVSILGAALRLAATWRPARARVRMLHTAPEPLPAAQIGGHAPADGNLQTRSDHDTS